MKRFLPIVFVLALFSAQSVFAWGYAHKLIAAVAEKHLTERTQKNLNLYLDHSIVEYAEWMDVYRNGTPYHVSTWWHMITIDENGEPSGTTRPNGDGDGIPQMVRIINEMKDWRNLPDSLVNLNLKWMIHMVGDNHCPAHIFFADLPGGPQNRYGWFRLKYKGQTKAYHGLWDQQSTTDSNPELAKDLYAYRDYIDRYTKEEREAMAQGDPWSWARETAKACRPIYDWAKPGDSIDQSFFVEHKDLTESQIAKAGYRLARLLNDFFDN